jgi:hypothetical protein
MAGAGIFFLVFALLALPFALLRDLFRLGRGAARLARNRRNVPLQQRNMTRATAGIFALVICAILAAHGFPVIGWKPTAGIAAVALLYLLVGMHGSQSVDVMAGIWWAALVIGVVVFLFHSGFSL